MFHINSKQIHKNTNAVFNLNNIIFEPQKTLENVLDNYKRK